MADQTTPNTTPNPAGDDAAVPVIPGGATPRIPDAYNESKIRVLDDVEHVRTRPGMYIGGDNAPRPPPPLFEIVAKPLPAAPARLCQSILL